MAWYNSGTWDGLPVQLGATLLSQILYAINERQAAQGVTVTSWDSPISTTYPSAANCAMPFSDLLNILGDAQTAITNLCNTKNPGNVRFVESDYTTQYTITNLLGDGSHGSSWVTPDRAQNGVVWLQIREALDLLVYIKSEIVNTPTLQSWNKYLADGDTQQDAWDAAIAGLAYENPSLQSALGQMLMWYVSTTNPKYKCTLRTLSYLSYVSYSEVGSIVEGGKAYFRKSTYGLTGAVDPPSFTIATNGNGGDTITMDLLKGETEDVELTIPEEWPMTFEIENLPSTQPFTALVYAETASQILQYGDSLGRRIDTYQVRHLIPGTHLTYG